jgi:hypothetical protein
VKPATGAGAGAGAGVPAAPQHTVVAQTLAFERQRKSWFTSRLYDAQ